ARLYHFSVALAALSACALFLDGRKLALGRGGGRSRVVLLIALLASALLFMRRAQLGISLDASDIARALGSEKRTAHFVLHYNGSGPWAKDIALHAEDAEL